MSSIQTFTRLIHDLIFPDFRVKVSQSVFLENFNSIVVDVPAEDMYYLLQTFASMALTREIDDIDFIRCITTDLFKVQLIRIFSFFHHLKSKIQCLLLAGGIHQCTHPGQLL